MWLEFGILHVVVSMLCVLLSILLHELGHVFAGWMFGTRGYIVLWAMGGLAVGSNPLHSRWKRIIVSAAGPFIQLALFVLLLLLLPFVPGEPPRRRAKERPATAGHILRRHALHQPLLAAAQPAADLPARWRQIAHDLFTAVSRDGVLLSLLLSIGVCGLLAVLALLVGAYPDRALSWLPISPQHPLLPGLCRLQHSDAHARKRSR